MDDAIFIPTNDTYDDGAEIDASHSCLLVDFLFGDTKTTTCCNTRTHVVRQNRIDYIVHRTHARLLLCTRGLTAPRSQHVMLLERKGFVARRK